jgi:dienelactone hydrolase
MAFETLTFASGSAIIPGELFVPGGAASTGLVVLAYGTDGLEDNERGPWKTMMHGYAEALAEAGLFALIPNYFKKTDTIAGIPAAEVILLKRDDWSAALADTVTHARALPRVDPSRIGLLGFSLGGHLCLRIRAEAKPQALVEFFAPNLDGIGPAGVVPFAQIHHGKNDQLQATQFSNAAIVEGILKSEGTDVTLFPYEGANHGFAGNDKANKEAATLSQSRTLQFFKSHL